MQYVYLNGKEPMESGGKPELVIIRGHHGSGKTTMAEKISKQGYIHHEQEKFFINNKGEYEFHRELEGGVKEAVFNNVMEDLKKGNNVVVSELFTKNEEVEKFIKMAKEAGAKVNVIGMDLKYESDKKYDPEIVRKTKNAYEKSDYEQTISNSDISFVTGGKQVADLLKQEEVLTGKKVPRLFIADTMERIKLAEVFVANQYSNSDENSFKKKLRGEDYDSVHKINGSLAVGQIKDAQERFDHASSYTKLSLSPKELFNVLRNEGNDEIKEKIQEVLIEYSWDHEKAAKMDEEVTKQIYKEIYGLNVDMKQEHKAKTPRMGL